MREKKKIIARGAEAIILKEKNSIIKQRILKGYRHPMLDNKLRSQRTRAEARLLEKAAQIVNVPRIILTNEITKELTMEKILGKRLADWFDKLKNKKEVAKKIGEQVAKLHDANMIHGDLTTSNMILKKQTAYLIDFGLGFHSTRVEDKAVDIHVFKEALEAKHPKHHESLYNAFLKGYRCSKNAPQVLGQLEKVEKRGRYKAQY